MALPDLTPIARVLIAKKTFHKGMFHRAAAYGNTTMKLDDNFAIEIVKTDGDFLKVQLYRYGMDSIPTTQSWQPTKQVKVAAKKKAKPKKRELQKKTGPLRKHFQVI